jgi:XrtJ-associated TM-motif-TM protein
MKKSTLLLFGSLLLISAVSAHAQNGCDDSPENPTAILALVGSAGAILASVRTRVRSRRKAAQK